MQLLAIIYVWFFRLRELLFGYTMQMPAPPDFDPAVYPVILDPWTLGSKLLVNGLFHIPAGKPFSNHYNEDHELWQAWAGQYFIFSFKALNFPDTISAGKFLAQVALADQRGWLKTSGVEAPVANLVSGSVKIIDSYEQQGRTWYLLYGEILSSVDESKNKKRSLLISRLSPLAAKLYSNFAAQTPLEKDFSPANNSKVSLQGYWSFTKVSARRYAVSYACVRSEAFTARKTGMLNSVRQATLLPTR